MNRLATISWSILMVATLAACKRVDHSETSAQAPAMPPGASSETSPTAAPSDDDLFINEVVGFSVRKPTSWRFGPTSWDEAGLDRLDFRDDEFADLVLRNATEPLVVIAKYDDTADALSPVFRATFRPLGQLSKQRPEQIAEMLIPQLRDSFAGFELIEGVARAEVSGLPAAHFASSFTVDDLSGATHEILAETWLVKRGDYLFLLGTSATRADPSREDLGAIVDSFTIDPRAF